MISAQIIELLILAVIAFVLVNRLVSILGTTNEPDGSDDSFFGESFVIKDVTEKPVILPKDSAMEDFVVKENLDKVVQTLPLINSYLPGFDLLKFIAGSKAAFGMIIDALMEDKGDVLDALVDKRFTATLLKKKKEYKTVKADSSIDAKVSELYLFGNSVFIKVLFAKTAEIWTFMKNSNDKSSNWFLCNIESA
ncbi:MAG: hypothetical protein KA998_03790 [Rickettsiaceae bacterium]|nr:hypothetical protein [Rickettsiaceae bacterium]